MDEERILDERSVHIPEGYHDQMENRTYISQVFCPGCGNPEWCHVTVDPQMVDSFQIFRRVPIFRATRLNLPSHRRPLSWSQPAWYVWSPARSRSEEQ